MPRTAVVVEERNAPTAAGSRLGRKLGQPFLSWPLALFSRHFRSSFLFAAVELQDNQLGQVVQSPEVTWLCALGCDRRQRCRSRPRAALHVRVRQRLQILPPEEGVPWSGQKAKRDHAACKDGKNAAEKPVAVPASGRLGIAKPTRKKPRPGAGPPSIHDLGNLRYCLYYIGLYIIHHYYLRDKKLLHN